MGKQSLIKGASILIMVAFLSELIGLVNSVVMARVLGPEGTGLMMMVMPFILFFITLTTLGLDDAVAKVVAEYDLVGNTAMIKRVLTISLTITTALCLFLTIGMLLLSKPLSALMLSDEKAYFPLLAATLISPVIAVSSVLKGYFRGKQDMTPIAVSQIISQVVNTGLMFVIIRLMIPYGLAFAVTGAVICAILGESAALLYIGLVFNKTRRAAPVEHRSLLYEFSHGRKALFDLLKIGIPITGTNLIHSITGIFQPIIVMHSLALTGIGIDMATKQYGILMGFSLPLIFFPFFVSQSLSIQLIPAISEAKSQNNTVLIHDTIRQSLKVSLTVGIPWTILLCLFPTVLTRTFYHSEEAGTFIQLLAPFYLLNYLRIPFGAIIIGLGKAKQVMFNHFFSSLLSLAAIQLLASNPRIGIYGVAIAFCIDIVAIFYLHFFTIVRLVGFYVNMTDFFKVLTAGFIMGTGALAVYRYLTASHVDGILLLVMLLSASLLIYLIPLYFFKIFKFTKPQ